MIIKMIMHAATKINLHVDVTATPARNTVIALNVYKSFISSAKE